ncbi:MCM2/3/5 family-domain-containing protein [Amylostereum chailletii]|nr:MCM2/3/5 family-domain-containing protein [Amylostereum chailletii]
MSFEANRVFTVSVHNVPPAMAPDSPSETERLLLEFLLQYRVGGEFIYRDKLRANLLLKHYQLEVDLRHIGLYNDELAHAIQNIPADVLPLFENAATKASRTILFPLSRQDVEPEREDDDDDDDDMNAEDAERRRLRELVSSIPKIQVSIKSGLNMLPFRELTANTVTKLVRIPGIVISASVLSSRATKLHLACRACHSVKVVYPSAGLGGIGGGADRGLPRVCDAPASDGQKKDCPMDPYLIVHSKSKFSDHQMLKLQEAPDMVPVGELPRHILLSADRYITGQVVPGSRVIATGIYSTYSAGKDKSAGAAALRSTYLRLVHLELSSPSAAGSSGFNPFGVQFTPEEEEEFGEMARSDGFYERFAKSVAPSIFGSLDIKKAITCLLFGGSKKILPDGMRLRGDINVLLLGDPGTAKSQLLKFVEKVAPIAVYTSGKGSSAAGLTASVQRDSVSREFYLEGGAMVLADTGVVCIDEFDKMRDEDRVAIHEAMEQQTISIAKAGITTVLNSRTSVLAAANPVWGRYDDARSPGENIDFQTTILSRFDMIFIVKDEHNEQRDRMIAKHVMNIHMNRPNQNADENGETVGEIDLDKMKRYISYCKTKCAPRLSPDASEMLSSHFVSLRKEVQLVEQQNDERSSIPITVRQLEAIIRISESLSKMTLSPVVQPHHVEEAIRLFKFSTMDAVSAGSVDGLSRGQLNEEITKIEKEIRRRLPVGWSTSYQSLVREFVGQQKVSSHALERTLFVMEKREIIRFSGQASLSFPTHCVFD